MWPLWVSLVLGVVGVPVYWLAPAHRRGWVLAALGVLTVGGVAPGPVLGAGALTVGLWLALGERPSRWVAVGAVGALVASLLGVKVAMAAGLQVGGHPVLLPLGASFLAFRLIDWVLTRRRGSLARQPLGEVLGWALMPALFVSGPIEGLAHHQRFTSATLTAAHVREGLLRLFVGLGKKLVLADLVVLTLMQRAGVDGPLVAEGLRTSTLTVTDAWAFASLSFLHLYLDFSGYSDLAIGVGRLFGLTVTENFRSPFLARDPADFWRRWHISLAEWCRRHVYMPMVGVSRSPYVAALTTFLVMGLWHAPSLPWVLWGLWHGALLCGVILWRRWRRGRPALPSWTLAGAIPLTVTGAVVGHALAALAGQGGPWLGPALFLRLFALYLPWVPQ